MANSEDPDEMPHSAASHLGLQCLLWSVCQNTYGKYGILIFSLRDLFSFWFLFIVVCLFVCLLLIGIFLFFLFHFFKLLFCALYLWDR